MKIKNAPTLKAKMMPLPKNYPIYPISTNNLANHFIILFFIFRSVKIEYYDFTKKNYSNKIFLETLIYSYLHFYESQCKLKIWYIYSNFVCMCEN